MSQTYKTDATHSKGDVLSLARCDHSCGKNFVTLGCVLGNSPHTHSVSPIFLVHFTRLMLTWPLTDACALYCIPLLVVISFVCVLNLHEVFHISGSKGISLVHYVLLNALDHENRREYYLTIKPIRVLTVVFEVVFRRVIFIAKLFIGCC